MIFCKLKRNIANYSHAGEVSGRQQMQARPGDGLEGGRTEKNQEEQALYATSLQCRSC
jgi:hypothetical protein